MSDSEDNTKSTDRPDKNRPNGDYDVGYCKPPVAHRFKHGNKANPNGRRKGSQNRKLVIQDVMFEAVTVREGDQIKQKTLSKALAGDNKAALMVIGIAQKEGILTPAQEQAVEDLSETDLAIMADVRRRLEAAAPEQSPEGEVPPSGV